MSDGGSGRRRGRDGEERVRETKHSSATEQGFEGSRLRRSDVCSARVGNASKDGDGAWGEAAGEGGQTILSDINSCCEASEGKLIDCF